ncbi:hypothetical protein [Elongatibacter sediminis]|uniref:UDP-N-acetylglucosamine 2-epimerase domain-containing protein n=1 Tax=Elongatibacter sediminis TaxID=3119006 RepID=A0AAW9RL04_9GAMM
MLYRHYIRDIYDSLNFEEIFLIIKMHPNDSLIPNVYLEELPAHAVRSTHIFEPNSQTFNFYDLLSIADVLITRASTAAEEALLLSTPCIAFDLFQDGPSTGLGRLQESEYFRMCVRGSSDLEEIVQELLNAHITSQVSDTTFIAETTYKLDGCSTERVCEYLLAIADRSRK